MVGAERTFADGKRSLEVTSRFPVQSVVGQGFRKCRERAGDARMLRTHRARPRPDGTLKLPAGFVQIAQPTVQEGQIVNARSNSEMVGPELLFDDREGPLVQRSRC